MTRRHTPARRYPPGALDTVIERDGPHCALCHTELRRHEMTLDHIIPVRHRPDLESVLSNLQIACRPCNSRKGSRLPDTHHIAKGWA